MDTPKKQESSCHEIFMVELAELYFFYVFSLSEHGKGAGSFCHINCRLWSILADTFAVDYHLCLCLEVWLSFSSLLFGESNCLLTYTDPEMFALWFWVSGA